jgi:hypothetical protein
MRKTLNFTITDEGRDKGKVFVLTEMSAAQAESWAMKALLGLIGSNAEMPENFSMASLAEYGLKSLMGLKWETAEPLLSEMFSCVQIMPDATKAHIIRPLIESDIEEIMTRVKLRAEVWKLHTGFLNTAEKSEHPVTAVEKLKGSITRTSRKL